MTETAAMAQAEAPASLSKAGAYLFLTLATLFWGGNYVVGKVMAGGDIPPVTLAFLRWTPACLVTVLLFRRHWQAQRRHIRENIGPIVILALLGVVCVPTTLYIGLRTATTLNAAIFLSATPLVVVLINRILFAEPVGGRAVLAVLSSLAGVAVLIAGDDPAKLLQAQFHIGDLWTAGSAFAWALYCALLRLVSPRLSQQSFLSASMVIGTLVLLPLAGIETWADGWSPVAVAPGSWLGVAYLALFPSILSYYFWNRGLGVVGSSRGMQFNHVVPLSSALLGILLLGESFEARHAVATALIVAGILINGAGRR